ESLSGGVLYPQFFTDEVVSVTDFMDVLDGYGIWYYIDETAIIHFGQLVAPDLATAAYDFADTNVIGEIQVDDDKAPGLTSRLSYGENPGAYTQDELAGGVSNADRVLMTNLNYVVENTTAPIIPFYSKATTREPVKLALAHSSGSNVIAQEEIDRWWTDLYPKRRRFYTFAVLINDSLFDDRPLPKLGDFCSLQSDNFDLLETPINLLIRKTRFNFSTGLLTIQGWG
ncbi:MAG: hypothetical protein ACREO9_01150, partial [Lysobacterales bacterium]